MQVYEHKIHRKIKNICFMEYMFYAYDKNGIGILLKQVYSVLYASVYIIV